jgi:hypothetical protein
MRSSSSTAIVSGLFPAVHPQPREDALGDRACQRCANNVNFAEDVSALPETSGRGNRDTPGRQPELVIGRNWPVGRQMDPAFTRKRTTEVSPNLKIFGGKPRRSQRAASARHAGRQADAQRTLMLQIVRPGERPLLPMWVDHQH